MKNKRNPRPFYLAFALTVALLAGLQALFHFTVPDYVVSTREPVADMDSLLAENRTIFTDDEEIADDEDETDEVDVEDEAEPMDVPVPADTVPSSIPVRSRVGHRAYMDGKNWNEAFPDSQATQLSAALLNGITPAATRDEIMFLVQSHQLVDITHSPLYHVDPLSHSVPYLVPKAQELLNVIAVNFLDSLSSQGLSPHLPIVTSVLRTTDDVSRLQRGNKNATSNSCHCYGTTIDITYHRFQPLALSTPVTRYDEQLKRVLGCVLYDLRMEGRCYVKYEYKQACFHLTVR